MFGICVLLILFIAVARVNCGGDRQVYADHSNEYTKSWIREYVGIADAKACDLESLDILSREMKWRNLDTTTDTTVYGAVGNMIGTTCFVHFYGHSEFVDSELQADSSAIIQADVYIHSMEQPKNWGLDRLDQVKLPLSNTFNTLWNGSSVTAYILDTGVNIDHIDYKDRVIHGDVFSSETTPDDLNGHGSHVTGLVGGTTFGVAKLVDLISVKVLNALGSGRSSDAIAGLSYVVERQADDFSSETAVIVMALGIENSETTVLNSAVIAASVAGHIIVTASGNTNGDACFTSPVSASEIGVISVGATDINDNEAFFSNTGECIDVLAPGVEITSSGIGGINAVKTLTGTSASVGFVSGAIAQLLQKHNHSKSLALDDLFTTISLVNSINLLYVSPTNSDITPAPTQYPTLSPTISPSETNPDDTTGLSDSVQSLIVVITTIVVVMVISAVVLYAYYNR